MLKIHVLIYTIHLDFFLSVVGAMSAEVTYLCHQGSEVNWKGHTHRKFKVS